MSTFVVRFIGEDHFQGRVQHVTSQEETSFTSVAELLLFFEELKQEEHEEEQRLLARHPEP